MQSITDFILQHRNDDPRDLALRQSRYPNIDIPYAVQQIAAWQTARKKLPLWAKNDAVIYPVHLSMEQCSSQLTAEYKTTLLPLQGREEQTGKFTLIDLTAGFGVDATMMGRTVNKLIYVERNEELCKIANNNLPLLGVKDFEVINGQAEEVLDSLPNRENISSQKDEVIIFLDPARRDEHGGKTVQIGDCTPDVSQLQDVLLDKADLVMIKLSPMLDIANIVKELKCVKEIHVVSVENECKELLVLMSKDATNCSVHCINITKQNIQKYIASNSDRKAECHYVNELSAYLYEPNVSIMKAACFRGLAQTFNIDKLHPSSHLYTSDKLIADFPGRIFKVENVFSLKDKALKSIKKANLTVRNFPSTVAELRKRLKINEGGSDYLFATTLADESKVIVKCSKA